jgi:CRP/FNR family transcriptional regulator
MAQSDDSQIRVHALRGYELWGGQDAYDLAQKALEDQDLVVRSRALKALAVIDPHHCMEPIKAALGDSERLVRSSAAQALAAVGSPALPTALEALSTPGLEEGALLALEYLAPFEADVALFDYVRARVRTAEKMESYCLKLRATEADSPRLQLLHDSLRDRARRNILQALRAYRLNSNLSNVDYVIAGLQSQDDDQRANALELLEALDDEHLLAPALDLWESRSPMMYTGDRDSLEQIRDETILELLESEDGWLRACAVFALKTDGRPDIQAKLKLLCESDPDPLVRMTAAEQLTTEEAMESITTLPTMDRILFLREVPLFSELSPEELKQVASIAGEHIFKDGETFVKEGELGDEMFIIVSGNVHVYKGDEYREIALRGPGEFVGEMSILTQEPRMASLVAEGDVFALCLEQSNFEQMLLEKPEIGLSVMRALIQRLKDTRASQAE